MGGSSLGPEVIRRSFADAPGLTLHVLDSTDPGAILATERSIDLDKTMFVVSSKSGGTIETLSQMRYFYERCGGDGSRFCAVTDPGSPLVEEAKSRGFRRVFEADPNIGGRYSVLSHFGLVPAALAGIDIEALLRGAQVAEQNCQSPATPSRTPGCGWAWRWARSRYRGATRRPSPWTIRGELRPLGRAADRGVDRQGRARACCRWPASRSATPDEYGDDSVFVDLRDEEEPTPTWARWRRSRARASPCSSWPHNGAEDLGRDVLLRRVRRGGGRLGARHQPLRPTERAGGQGQHQQGARGRRPARSWSRGDLGDLLDGAAPPHYVAIMGYVQPSDEFDAAVTEMRVELRERTSCATTFGYGPRFLHSTGQFHKGGPPTGRFLQLIHDGDEDVEIPDAGYSFRHLKNAQAVGDLQTLRDHGLPAVQVRLEGDPAASAKEVI